MSLVFMMEIPIPGKIVFILWQTLIPRKGVGGGVGVVLSVKWFPLPV